MIIEEISIKNFKSYGNSTQTLKLNTKNGELILLSEIMVMENQV